MDKCVMISFLCCDSAGRQCGVPDATDIEEILKKKM